MSEAVVIVAGLGEVGRPLLRILNRCYDCVGVDLAPVQVSDPCSVLHICYPYQVQDFVGMTTAYIERYKPGLTVINSTVAIGTTRAVQERVGCRVAYSPVRGKHARMEQEMLSYQKFVAGTDAHAAELAAAHFAHAGFKVSLFSCPEAGELSKLIETTWLGILVGWAQDIERMAAQFRISYDEINEFIKEIEYLPSNVFPGHIGGHCVMPNIELLKMAVASAFLDAVVDSNELKANERVLAHDSKA